MLRKNFLLLFVEPTKIISGENQEKGLGRTLTCVVSQPGIPLGAKCMGTQLCITLLVWAQIKKKKGNDENGF